MFNNFRYIFLIIIIIIIIYKKNIYEKFIPEVSYKSNLLEKCFDKNTIENFKKYYNITDVLQTSNGIVFTTPSKYIDGLPQISWNGIFLNNLCVDPKMRKNGLGTKLVSTIINKAKKSGKDHIILQVKKNNIPAIKIYEKLGFTNYFEGINENGEETIIYVYYL